MNKVFKIILSVSGVLIVGIAILVISFIISMTPDRDKENAIKAAAENYITANFNDEFVVYDTLFDNMGNFGFEYAAKVRNQTNNIDFLVYQDSETKQIVDTYVASKWEYDLINAVRPYINEQIPDATDYYSYIPDEIGKEFDINPLNPGSYKDYSISPIIRITVSRKKGNQDDELFNEFVTFLKDEKILEHGTVIVAYIAENGEILEQQEWSREF